MKTFKIIDAWLQIALILGGLIFCIFYPQDFLYAYFVTGGWQLASCFIHEFFRPHYYPDPGRRRYLITVLITILLAIIFLLALICFDFFGSFIYGFLLLLLTPVMAVFYILICFGENKILKHKTFVHLK